MAGSSNPVAEYLKANKDKFTLDVLRQKLLEAGYQKEVIDQAVLEVFQIGGVKPAVLKATAGFFDFRNVKTYHTFGEKLVDFLIGWFLVGWLGSLLIYLVVVRFFSNFLDAYARYIFMLFSLLVIFALHIFGIFYFWKRRHYLARGLVFAILLSIILATVFILWVLWQLSHTQLTSWSLGTDSL